MKNAPIEALSPFTQPADWRTMMATMVEPALQATIAGQSQVMNEAWMGLIVDGGLLRMPKECVEGDPSELSDHLAQWGARIENFTRFMSGSSMGIENGMEYLRLDVSEGVKAIYTRATDDLVQDLRTLENYGIQIRQDEDNVFLKSVARWIAGAVAADLPESLNQVISAMPAAMRQSVPIEDLGRAPNDYILDLQSDNGEWAGKDSSIRLTPQGVALMLSRQTCLEVFEKHDQESIYYLGSHYIQGRDGSEEQSFGVLEIQDHIAPIFRPQTWYHAMMECFHNPIYSESGINHMTGALFDRSLPILEGNQHAYMDPYLPMLADTGVFKHDAFASLWAASSKGSLAVVQSVLPEIDWPQDEGFKTSLLVEAAKGAGSRNPGAHEKCALAILAHIREKGLGQGLKLEDDAGAHLVTDRLEPAYSFIDANFNRALIDLMKNGWDPKKNPEAFADRPTLLEYAEQNNPAMVKTIRAHQAHEDALKALDDIQTIRSPRPGQ